jgi:hypothetical protein
LETGITGKNYSKKIVHPAGERVYKLDLKDLLLLFFYNKYSINQSICMPILNLEKP